MLITTVFSSETTMTQDCSPEFSDEKTPWLRRIFHPVRWGVLLLNQDT